jgi:hypothetical protein
LWLGVTYFTPPFQIPKEVSGCLSVIMQGEGGGCERAGSEGSEREMSRRGGGVEGRR